MSAQKGSAMTPELFVEALEQIDSPTVANAIEQLELRDTTEGYADLRLRRLVDQGKPMVGYAVTFKVDSTTPGMVPDRTKLVDLLAAVEASPKPCVVVCQEAGPRPERGCHMGDVIGTRVASLGAVGVVSGSGIRDLDGIREVGLSAYALGTVAGRGSWSITEVGGPVEVAGLPVRPGDLLHGDGDGLVHVPVDQPERLLELIDETRAKEADSRTRAGDGADLAH
jgi:4-hydroxy-4-methyl-2-oxoglutarate aldolase